MQRTQTAGGCTTAVRRSGQAQPDQRPATISKSEPGHSGLTRPEIADVSGEAVCLDLKLFRDLPKLSGNLRGMLRQLADFLLGHTQEHDRAAYPVRQISHGTLPSDTTW